MVEQGSGNSSEELKEILSLPAFHTIYDVISNIGKIAFRYHLGHPRERELAERRIDRMIRRTCGEGQQPLNRLAISTLIFVTNVKPKPTLKRLLRTQELLQSRRN